MVEKTVTSNWNTHMTVLEYIWFDIKSILIAHRLKVYPQIEQRCSPYINSQVQRVMLHELILSERRVIIDSIRANDVV